MGIVNIQGIKWSIREWLNTEKLLQGKTPKDPSYGTLTKDFELYDNSVKNASKAIGENAIKILIDIVKLENSIKEQQSQIADKNSELFYLGVH